jgi:hypothetical protein
MRLIALAAAAVGLVAAVTAAALLLVLDDDGRSKAPWASEFEAISRDYYARYVDPLAETRVSESCRNLGPNSGDQDCQEFVAVLDTAELELIAVTDRLDTFIGRRAPELAWDFVSELQAVEMSLSVLHRGDNLIIRGWRNSDQAIWNQGWEIRESPGAEVDMPRSAP